MTRKRGLRLLVVAAVTGVVMAGIGSPSAVTAPVPTLPPCTTQLVPQLGATTVNQGVGSYSNPGSNLVRGKDALIRFFLVTLPAVNSTCSGTVYIRSATLTVTSPSPGSAVYSTPALQTFGTGAPIPSSTVAVDSNADPKFVLPSNLANSCLSTSACTDTAPFTLTFTVSVTYATSPTAAAVALNPPLAGTTATFDKSSNALRVLVIPMGDRSQLYSSQFSDTARVAVENGFAALSRIYSLAGGVSSTLNTTSGGLRYKLDLAAMLDLKSVPGAYDANNRFCGTQANFDAGIKSQLAGFLSVYNSSITDPIQRADRVVGVVDKVISDGSTSAYNCAEAMASTVSPESWVRAIPDLPASGKNPPVPSMTGSLMAMEFAHTFGMDTTVSFHSLNTQADLTAPDKAYNVSSRSYIADDRSTMRFVSANPFNNNNALFEKDDFQHMLCNLGGSLTILPGTTTTPCPTSASTGTVVAAGPTFAIFGTTDFSAEGTKVLESYGSENLDHNDAIFVGSGGNLALQFFDGTNKIGADVTVPYSNKTSEHDTSTNLNTTNAVFGGVFDAPAGYTNVKLVYNGTTTLYERSSATLKPVSAGIGTFAPGGSLTIDKTLTTPEIVPHPRVYFLIDTTGSMGPAIDNVKANAQSIIDQVRSKTTDARFGVGDYEDFTSCTGDAMAPCFLTLGHAFKNDASFPGTDDSGAAAIAAIAGLGAVSGTGGDDPESQLFALSQLANPTQTPFNVNWGSGDIAKMAVLIGDNPSHDPICKAISGESADVTLASTKDALKAAGIRLIGVSLDTDGAGTASTGLDGNPTAGGAGQYQSACGAVVPDESYPAQATTLATATGGVVKTALTAGDVTNTILAGLTNLPVTVQPQVTTCDPNLAVAFDAASKTVTSGQPISFTETVSIAGSATPGSTLTCTVHFLLNGLLPEDQAFTQTLSINVTGGSGVIATFESANPAAIRAHVVYDCGNGEKEPAFVALEGTQVAANIVQFQQNLDPSLSCANATGTASLTIVGTNGVDAVSETVPTSSSTFPVADKAPSAAIYQPTLDAVIPFTSQFSLNGHVADPEDGNLTAHWTIVSAPASASIPSISNGDVVDVPPPSGGWPAGDYVIRLSGTDSHGHAATATVTVHVARYAFAGFFSPVDNPPVVNIGNAGRTYPLKWSLTQGGTAVSDLSAVVALRFAATGCGLQPTDPLETVASGSTDLRFDATAQQYIYNWKTPNIAGCYVVTLTLADGSTWPAFFQLK